MTVSSSNNIIINGLLDKYCEYNAASNLSTNLGSGTFSGEGITNVDPTTGTATFDPSLIDFAGQQQVTIIISLTFDGLFTFPQSTTVYRRPIVQIIQDVVAPNFRTVFCNQDPVVPISVSTFPSGGSGVFSGSPAISGNNFNPANATIGVLNPNNVIYTYTDLNGCTNTNSKSVVVNAVTTGLDFTGLNSKYCDKSKIDTLVQNNGGSPFVGGFFSGIGINGNTFNPSIAAQFNNGAPNQNYQINYTYVNAEGCQTVVQKSTQINLSPEVALSGFNASKEYCYGNSQVALNGTPSTTVSGTGVFSIKAQLPTILDPSTLSGNIFYPNNSTNSGTYTVLYKYTDNTTNCSNTDSATVIVHKLPNVFFTSLDSLYCVYDKDVLLDGSPVNGIYTSLGNTASIVQSKFQPTASGVGEHTITYSYTDEFGCSSSVTNITKVYGKPLSITGVAPHFRTSSLCENDLIQFTDFNSVLDTSRQAHSIIKTANWKFDNTVYQNAFKVDTALHLLAGNHSINYTLTTDKGCFNSFDTTITIGSYPKTAFTWDKICNLEKTKFLNTTTINVGYVANVVWNFSDRQPKDSIVLISGVTGDTSHTFATPATYNVILKAQSSYNCVTVDTQKVFILPAVTVTNLLPYSSDFEANTGGWVSSSEVDTLSSWALGIPAKSIINTTATGDHAWVTDLTGFFKPNEISYVYSPCFTLTDITRPMIRMDIWSATLAPESGANLQYSLDGDDWLTLGEAKSDGVNWYNNGSNIISRPSGTQALNQDGWTGMDTVGWKNARHVFDDAIGTNNNIRFRISFAGTTNVTDGFAFDNVWVGDRTRLILAEHFTNNSSPNTIVENNTLNNLIASNLLNNEPKDIVELQYHTAFPGPDQMNARNIPDAGARALYYGVTQVPYSSLDGSYYNGNTLGITQQMIDTRALYDPEFDITLAPNLTSGNVSGSVTIENKIPVSNPVTVYISLLERFVNNIQGANGEFNYQWVHAKFLPDAAGTSFAANWPAQSTQTINFNWDFTSANVYNPDKLAMIVFVQDNVTKEIYQTAYKGLGATVTTGVFDPTETSSSLSLYPNPANDITTVILSGKLSGEYNWVIIDELGRTVDQGKLKDQTDGFTINTLSYASGFYTLRLSNNATGVKTQKFVVVH